VFQFLSLRVNRSETLEEAILPKVVKVYNIYTFENMCTT
jgi:hypothetical protein